MTSVQNTQVDNIDSYIEIIDEKLNRFEKPDLYDRELYSIESSIDGTLKHLHTLENGKEHIDKLIDVCQNHGFIPQYMVSNYPSLLANEIKLSPKGDLFAIFSDPFDESGKLDRQIHVVQSGSCSIIMAINCPKSGGSPIYEFSQDSKFIAIVTLCNMEIWDIHDRNIIGSIEIDSDENICDFKWSDDDQIIAIQYETYTQIVSSKCELINTIGDDGPSVPNQYVNNTISISEDNSELLVVNDKIATYDIISGKCIKKIKIDDIPNSPLVFYKGRSPYIIGNGKVYTICGKKLKDVATVPEINTSANILDRYFIQIPNDSNSVTSVSLENGKVHFRTINHDVTKHCEIDDDLRELRYTTVNNECGENNDAKETLPEKVRNRILNSTPYVNEPKCDDDGIYYIRKDDGIVASKFYKGNNRVAKYSSRKIMLNGNHTSQSYGRYMNPDLFQGMCDIPEPSGTEKYEEFNELFRIQNIAHPITCFTAEPVQSDLDLRAYEDIGIEKILGAYYHKIESPDGEDIYVSKYCLYYHKDGKLTFSIIVISDMIHVIGNFESDCSLFHSPSGVYALFGEKICKLDLNRYELLEVCSLKNMGDFHICEICRMTNVDDRFAIMLAKNHSDEYRFVCLRDGIISDICESSKNGAALTYGENIYLFDGESYIVYDHELNELRRWDYRERDKWSINGLSNKKELSLIQPEIIGTMKKGFSKNHRVKFKFARLTNEYDVKPYEGIELEVNKIYNVAKSIGISNGRIISMDEIGNNAKPRSITSYKIEKNGLKRSKTLTPDVSRLSSSIFRTDDSRYAVCINDNLNGENSDRFILRMIDSNSGQKISYGFKGSEGQMYGPEGFTLEKESKITTLCNGKYIASEIHGKDTIVTTWNTISGTNFSTSGDDYVKGMILSADNTTINVGLYDQNNRITHSQRFDAELKPVEKKVCLNVPMKEYSLRPMYEEGPYFTDIVGYEYKGTKCSKGCFTASSRKYHMGIPDNNDQVMVIPITAEETNPEENSVTCLRTYGDSDSVKWMKVKCVLCMPMNGMIKNEQYAELVIPIQENGISDSLYDSISNDMYAEFVNGEYYVAQLFKDEGQYSDAERLWRVSMPCKNKVIDDCVVGPLYRNSESPLFSDGKILAYVRHHDDKSSLVSIKDGNRIESELDIDPTCVPYISAYGDGVYILTEGGINNHIIYDGSDIFITDIPFDEMKYSFTENGLRYFSLNMYSDYQAHHLVVPENISESHDDNSLHGQRNEEVRLKNMRIVHNNGLFIGIMN